MPKEFKEINFSVRPLQTNFATSLDSLKNLLAIDPSGVVHDNLASVAPGTDQNLLRQRASRLNAHKQSVLNQLEGYKNLPTQDPARVDALRRQLTNTDRVLNDINGQRRALKIWGTPGAAAQLAGQTAEVQSKINQLRALGVPQANLNSFDAINHELRIRGLAPIANVSKAVRPVAQVAPVAAAKPVAANTFDRAMGRLGGAAKRHPVMAVLGGLAAIGGAVKISKAQEAGRINADSYYIMDNNTMSMVPRAFPSREAAMQIRNESYPGAAINKGSTLISKA